MTQLLQYVITRPYLKMHLPQSRRSLGGEGALEPPPRFWPNEIQNLQKALDYYLPFFLHKIFRPSDGPATKENWNVLVLLPL